VENFCKALLRRDGLWIRRIRVPPCHRGLLLAPALSITPCSLSLVLKHTGMEVAWSEGNGFRVEGLGVKVRKHTGMREACRGRGMSSFFFLRKTKTLPPSAATSLPPPSFTRLHSFPPPLSLYCWRARSELMHSRARVPTRWGVTRCGARASCSGIMK
jgi:hypothetical protein